MRSAPGPQNDEVQYLAVQQFKREIRFACRGLNHSQREELINDFRADLVESLLAPGAVHADLAPEDQHELARRILDKHRKRTLRLRRHISIHCIPCVRLRRISPSQAERWERVEDLKRLLAERLSRLDDTEKRLLAMLRADLPVGIIMTELGIKPGSYHRIKTNVFRKLSHP